ncbi:MAG: 3-deoxy-8-phosphooctulonate synthase [Mangrovibacterium sp.]
MISTVKEVKINDQVSFGTGKFTLIAGPCAIESYEMCYQVASQLKRICANLGIDYVFKSSFDKANRTSVDAPRGIGSNEGLKVLQAIKTELDLPIITDIHEASQCERAAEVVDMLQIPAFLCRQTDLLLEAGKTGKAVNVKKGQFLAPWDMGNIVKKLESTGNTKILLCERGTTFGYNNLVVDMTGLVEMRKFGYPVVMDATHAVQKPSGQGNSTGGNREMVPYLMNAALSIGVDGIFAEVHPNPDKAFSDGPNQLHLEGVEELLTRAVAYDRITKGL